jgi:heme exporter protein C
VEALMEKKPVLLTVLDALTVIVFLAAAAMVFIYAPMEAVMGWVQKVFYFHVASGWVGMLGFLVAAVAGIAYLRSKDQKWDGAGIAGVEIGLVFMLICIITGSIWARPIWNTWWTWDPRLTTATIMELIYAAYLMLRSGIDDPEKRARFGAIYAIIGFVSVPLTFISIRLFRTIHPVVIGSSDPSALGAFDMSARMSQTFFFSLFAFSILFADLLWHRIRLSKLEEQVDHLKMELYQ